MTHIPGDRRRTSRLAVLPAVFIGLAIAGGTLAPAAQASIPAGSWSAPQSGSTVSGSKVQLSFTTNQSAVTFVLPYGTEAATVSGGVATGTFDSTKATNGPATLGAMECDTFTGCSTTNETVTVANTAPAPAPAPTPTPVTAPLTVQPTSGAIAPGSTITIDGSGPAAVNISVDGASVLAATVGLPYVYTLPTLSQGLHSASVQATQGQIATGAYYTVTEPDTTPPVISKLSYRRSYFPVRDGFLDHFYAIFSVNEASTAVLAISKGGKVVSSGTLPISNTKLVDLRAGDKLKAGTYQWQLIVTDTAGNVTRTPMRTVLADGRHTINHPASVTMTAASAFYKSFSGSCSTAKKSGTTVVVSSLSKCSSGSDTYFDVASARFLPVLKSAVDYGSVTVKVHTSGTGLFDALNIASGQFDVVKKLSNGTTTVKLGDQYVGYPKPELIVDVLTGAKHTVTVTSISVSYVYKTLSKI